MLTFSAHDITGKLAVRNKLFFQHLKPVKPKNNTGATFSCPVSANLSIGLSKTVGYTRAVAPSQERGLKHE